MDAFIEDNWYTVRSSKQTLVGTIKDFGVANYGDESDWNIHLSPAIGFESFLSDALKRYDHNTDEWGLSPTGNYTIEAEITPITKAFNNPWFNNVTHKTYLLNKQIGVYGPFVVEKLHGYRPEIHPVEQIWWKDRANSTVILLVADASNRFDQMSDFNTNFAAPGPLHPWTQDEGQEAELKIPFEINPANGSLIYTLYSLYDNNSFYSGANYRDTSNGTTHTITYKGAEVLTIMESSTVEKYVGVTFRDVCFDNSNSMLKGYIVLKTAIGNGGGGKEGFVALQLDKSKYDFNEKPGILTGDIINTSNTWTAFNTHYDNDIPISDDNVISSDKYGKGTVDGIIDFNGNGKTDLFAVKGNKWMVLYDGLGKWQEINRANEQLKDLFFGDVDGNDTTDILYLGANERLLVSFNGTRRWSNYSHIDVPGSQLKVGDFNADVKTDLVKIILLPRYAGGKKIKNIMRINIKWSCKDDWDGLNSFDFIKASSTYNSNEIRLGHFNGDKKTDIFRSYNKKFMVYCSGKGDMEELYRSLYFPLSENYNINDVLFVDNLSRIGYTDIIYAKRSTSTRVWKIYYEGRRVSPGRILTYSNPLTVNFGNLDNDAFWEPFVVDAVWHKGLPTDFVSLMSVQ